MPILNEQICAVVVTYQPDPSVVDHVRALLAHVDHVVVIDNNSMGVSRTYVMELSHLPMTTVYWNEANLGIATALNTGVRYAMENDYGWLAVFDQDSAITDTMFVEMSKAYDGYPMQDRVAIVCPRYRDPHTKRPITMIQVIRTAEYAELLTTLSSGNLVKMSVFRDAGTFLDELFIDAVDTEFDIRCLLKKYVILEAQHAWLDHSLGQATSRFRIRSHNYPSHRRYYIIRNEIWVFRHYWPWIRAHPVWMLRHIFSMVGSVVFVLIVEGDRLKKIRFICLGAYHGLSGRTGPIKLRDAP